MSLFPSTFWPELWLGKRSGLQYPVESQNLSESSTPIILVPIRRGEEHGLAFGVLDLNRISAGAGLWHRARTNCQPNQFQPYSRDQTSLQMVWEAVTRLSYRALALPAGCVGLRAVCEQNHSDCNFGPNEDKIPREPLWLKPSCHGSFATAGTACMLSRRWARSASESLRLRTLIQESVSMALRKGWSVCSCC